MYASLRPLCTTRRTRTRTCMHTHSHTGMHICAYIYRYVPPMRPYTTQWRTCARVFGCTHALTRAPISVMCSYESSPSHYWQIVMSAAQAFAGASAFNANIGAWNTASVSNMAGVCMRPSLGHRAPTRRGHSDRFRCGWVVVCGDTARMRERKRALVFVLCLRAHAHTPTHIESTWQTSRLAACTRACTNACMPIWKYAYVHSRVSIC